MDTHTRQKKILIVDDDATINSLLQRKFANDGFAVKGCFNGVEGMELLTKEKFDGIVLDIIMPMKDGISVLKEKAATINADTPTYVLTSMSHDERVDLAEINGAKEVFRKIDMTPGKVVDAVAEELAKR